MKLYQIFCMLGLSIVALAEQTESICGATCGVGSDDPTGNELLIRCGICDSSDPQVCRVGDTTHDCTNGDSCISGCYHDTNPFSNAGVVCC